MTEHDLKTELFWLSEGAVHPRTAAAALERIEALEAEVARLRGITAVTMGVGKGDGKLFVHGDYESINAARQLMARAERAEALLREFMACRRIKDGREIGWIVSGPTEPTLLHVLAKVRAALEAKP